MHTGRRLVPPLVRLSQHTLRVLGRCYMEVLWNLLEDHRRIYHGVNLLFQWNIPMGSTGLVGLITASTGANRVTDSNILGGQINLMYMGLRLWNSMEIHGAAWRIIWLQCSSCCRFYQCFRATGSARMEGYQSSTVDVDLDQAVGLGRSILCAESIRIQWRVLYFEGHLALQIATKMLGCSSSCVCI